MENTIALGGVAIGSIKAQEALHATIAARETGGKPKPSATEIKMGVINAAVAVLEVNSVRKTINAVSTSVITSQCCTPI